MMTNMMMKATDRPMPYPKPPSGSPPPGLGLEPPAEFGEVLVLMACGEREEEMEIGR